MEQGKKELGYPIQGLIAATIFTILPLVGLFAIPNTWWGLSIKVILILFELANLKNCFFNPTWTGAKGFSAGIVLNMIFFSVIWFVWPHWIAYIFCILFLITLGVMKDALGKVHESRSKN
ncbi:hypothetical protein KJ969_03695 [Patescibacteria group bacterium]|nr:hypothetical protein [Patescibacteria group bacterium]MBU1922219.1 hypothetical protein [Patescibacteria group bacterium]